MSVGADGGGDLWHHTCTLRTPTRKHPRVRQPPPDPQPVIDLVLADYEHPLGRVLREMVGARLPTVFFTPLGALMPFIDYPPQYVPTSNRSCNPLPFSYYDGELPSQCAYFWIPGSV